MDISRIPPQILARIPEHQRTVFLPQLLQFDGHIVPTEHGLLARAESPEGGGWIWALSLDDGRLLSVVRMAFHQAFPLRETPSRDYWCIGLLCESSMQMMSQIWAADQPEGTPIRAGSSPGPHPFPTFEREQVGAFKIHAGDYRFALAENTVHSSAHLHLFPSAFEQLEGQYPGCLPRLREYIEARGEYPQAVELRRLLRQISPRYANDPGALLRYRGLADQIIAEFYAVAETRVVGGPTKPAYAIVEEARELLEASLAEPPTIDQLARSLHVGRTRLCREFKQMTGATIGEFLSRLRMQKAKELLGRTTLPMGDIARQVGYRHESTFCTAFKQAEGCPPGEWRKQFSSEHEKRERTSP